MGQVGRRPVLRRQTPKPPMGKPLIPLDSTAGLTKHGHTASHSLDIPHLPRLTSLRSLPHLRLPGGMVTPECPGEAVEARQGAHCPLPSNESSSLPSLCEGEGCGLSDVI